MTSDHTPSGIWQQLTQEIEQFLTDIREVRVVTPVSQDTVRDELHRRFDFHRPAGLDVLIAEVCELLRKWQVHVTHPRYFGLFNPSIHEAGIVGDALAALYNPQLAAWSHSPFMNELEQFTLQYLGQFLGWGQKFAAHFTSGGAEANTTALLVALAARHPQVAQQGVRGIQRRPMIYVTADSHHSIAKAVRMSGLGADSLHVVPEDPSFAMDPDALKSAVAADRRSGHDPLLIVGNAGTTSAGAIDPLAELADVAADCNAWFHVDGAWGAAALLVPRLRSHLNGMARADSVTWDAHKWLSVPMGAGMFFCRHFEAPQQAFAQDNNYMPFSDSTEAIDPYASTMQWSRRATGLKVFLTLATLGHDQLSSLIEKQARMGERLREMLVADGWQVINSTPLPVVCFTTPELAHWDDVESLLRRVYERGQVWLSGVRLGGHQAALRACITSYRTEEADLERLVEEVGRGRGKGKGER